MKTTVNVLTKYKKKEGEQGGADKIVNERTIKNIK